MSLRCPECNPSKTPIAREIRRNPAHASSRNDGKFIGLLIIFLFFHSRNQNMTDLFPSFLLFYHVSIIKYTIKEKMQPSFIRHFIIFFEAVVCI